MKQRGLTRARNPPSSRSRRGRTAPDSHVPGDGQEAGQHHRASPCPGARPNLRPSDHGSRPGDQGARGASFEPRTARIPHAGLRPAGDQGDGQGTPAGRGRRLGYDIVLGNTFHLPSTPGRADRRPRRPARVHGLGAGRSSPTPAASRSSAWATAPSPTRSRAARRRPRPRRQVLEIAEDGRPLPLHLDGSEKFLGPRPRWRSRRRWAPTSRSSSTSARRSTSTAIHSALDRAHAPLACRCLDWHAEHGPDGQLVYGIVQGGVHEDLRVEWRRRSPPARSTASRSAARSAPTRPQMYEVVDWTTARAARGPAAPPAGDRRDRRPHPRRRARASTRSTARCRRALAATAWRSSPTRAAAGASTSRGARSSDSRRAAHGGLPVPGVRARAYRGYFRYLVRTAS